MVVNATTDHESLPGTVEQKREEPSDGEPVPLRIILAMTCGLGGLQVVWSTIFSHGTIYLQTLGLTDASTSLLWAIPAVCGCFIQPLCGASSDICTHSWGKRKPYIVAGAFGTTASIITLAYASSIGSSTAAILSPRDPWRSTKTVTEICVVLSICGLSLALVPLQCALRALPLDLCPPKQQVQVQSWVVRFVNFGYIVGSVAGLLYLPGAESFGEILTFRILSTVAVLAVDLTTFLTVWKVKEIPNHQVQRQASLWRMLNGLIRNICGTYTNSPPLVHRILIIQFLAWMGWFTFLFYNTSYINSLYVTSADTRADDKTSGYVASLAGLLFSGVAFAGSVLLPNIITTCSQYISSTHRARGVSKVPSYSTLLYAWSLSLALSTILMSSTLFFSSFRFTVALMAINGISWAVAQWVPFALIGECTVRQSRASDSESDGACKGVVIPSGGAINGLHNVAISAPQILAAAMCGIVLQLTQQAGSSSGSGWVLRMGALPFCTASYIALRSARGVNDAWEY